MRHFTGVVLLALSISQLSVAQPDQPQQQQFNSNDNAGFAAQNANAQQPPQQAVGGHQALRENIQPNAQQQQQQAQQHQPVNQQPPQQQQQQQQQAQRVLNAAQQQQQQRPGERPGNRSPGNNNLDGTHIWDYHECKEDILRHCSQLQKKDTDWAVLACLQNAGEKTGETLTPSCAHLVWEFRYNLTTDERFSNAAKSYCSAELERADIAAACSPAQTQRPGFLLSCLLDYKDNITKSSGCFKLLSRTEELAFADFRLIGPFLDACRVSIQQYKCGRSTEPKVTDDTKDNDVDPDKQHSQGGTLECLIEKLVELYAKNRDEGEISRQIGDQCRHQVMRLAEMQADDYHLDRPLFFACREEREKFCRDVQAGEGRVFTCLLHNKQNRDMHPTCRKILEEREALMGQDYQMSHPLVHACGADIQKHCAQLNQATEEQRRDHYYLSYVVLCLENAQAAQQQLADQCKYELNAHRQLLISDYKLSPEIVISCAEDINQWCGGQVQSGGNTLQCLMGVAAHAAQMGTEGKPKQAELKSQCVNAIATVVKAANVAEHPAVDRVLMQSCNDILTTDCKDEATGSHLDTLSCLMRHLEDEKMTDECEDRLLEIQYFLARDWSLDPSLYKACKNDAVAKCNADPNWYTAATNQQQPPNNQPDPGPIVLSCLYRHAYADDDAPDEDKLSIRCEHEVHRALRERATRVNLMPDIELHCRAALALHCSHNTLPNQEMMCLQENMEKIKEETDEKCYEQIVKYTEYESKDTKLNRVLTRACSPVVKSHCAHLENEEIDHGDVMECLLANKGSKEMTHKCAEYVKHFELVSMRDYHFSYRFKQACKADIKNYCNDHNIQDKTTIVQCLSEVVFNHRVLGAKEKLAPDCGKQLQVAYLDTQRAEYENNPAVMRACKSDIQSLKCYDQRQQQNTAEVIECLREHKLNLTGTCRQVLFGMEKAEANDNTLDVQLQRTCFQEIKSLCANAPGERVLKCLRRQLNAIDMGAECRHLVQVRMREKASDVRLRPGLLHECKDDIQAHCKSQYEKLNERGLAQTELEGEVVQCLKQALIDRNSRNSVTHKCKVEVRRVILEAEIDPQTDLPFYRACKNDLAHLCHDQLIYQDPTHPTLMECMKAAYIAGTLNGEKCKKEMNRRTSEDLADIHLDPVLHAACAQEISRYCKDAPPGQGRILSCLLSASQSTNTRITDSCRVKLDERQKLWRVANVEPAPESVGDFIQLASDTGLASTLLSYLLGILLCIFVVGLCCGRVTKRVKREMKDR